MKNNNFQKRRFSIIRVCSSHRLLAGKSENLRDKTMDDRLETVQPINHVLRQRMRDRFYKPLGTSPKSLTSLKILDFYCKT